METQTGYCDLDGRVRVQKKEFNTTPHLLLSVITLGIWIPFWLLAAFWPRAWRCTTCGGAVKIVGERAVRAIERRGTGPG